MQIQNIIKSPELSIVMCILIFLLDFLFIMGVERAFEKDCSNQNFYRVPMNVQTALSAIACLREPRLYIPNNYPE